jgi:hypothetical protein
MNFCREIKTTSELLQIFLGRFQLLPQHCPAAQNLGFKFIVRHVCYNPNSPFTVYETAYPFKDEDAATKFRQQKIDRALANIAKFTEEDRQHYIKYMVKEDGENNWTTQPTYDALLIRYLPQLLGKEPTQTETQTETPTETQEEAKQEPLPTPTASTAELDQLSNKIQEETALVLDKFLEKQLDELYEIEAKVSGETAFYLTVLLERGLEEVNQIKAKMEEESALILDQNLETKLEEIYEIEANIQREAWTVIAKIDTIMLKTWLNEASKFQEEMNKTVTYKKSGRLDWETNKFKLEAIVTKNGAIAPQPVQLTTDARFSAPMLSMARRRTAGVKMLREISKGGLKENRARIDNIIKL